MDKASLSLGLIQRGLLPQLKGTPGNVLGTQGRLSVIADGGGDGEDGGEGAAVWYFMLNTKAALAADT